MSMNEDIKGTIIKWCAHNNLRIAHAVDLYYNIRCDLGWSEDCAASDEIKASLLSMRRGMNDLYGISHALLDDWISAL